MSRQLRLSGFFCGGKRDFVVASGILCGQAGFCGGYGGDGKRGRNSGINWRDFAVATAEMEKEAGVVVLIGGILRWLRRRWKKRQE